MSIGNRILTIPAGLLVSLSAVWGANKMSMMYNPWGTLARSVSMGIGSILIVLFVLALFIGVIIFAQFIEHMLNGKRLNDSSDVFFMTLNATCFGFVFGAISPPARIQDGIVFWTTGFNFLLILGLIPAVIVVKDLIVDIAGALRTKAVAR